MKWRTEITIPKIEAEIDHGSSIFLIGSCFTDEIGSRLKSQMFDATVNPLGTLFNPISIADALDDALDGKQFSADELFEVDGTWRTLRRHSRFSLPDRDATLRLLNDSLTSTRKQLVKADFLIVTFGSAIAHRHIPSGEVAANCHKQPAELFSVERLTCNDITAKWRRLLDKIFTQNPKLKVIFTVSPVRHIGYGLERDRLSKSTLIVAVHDLLGERVQYFPSYEIVVDDLRDYRWYADDLVHPSAQAVNYVYDIFRQSVMTPATITQADRWSKLTRRLEHRHSSCEAESAFLKETIELAHDLAGDNNDLLQRFIDLKQ